MLADFDAWTATAAATPADDLHILGRSFLKSYMAYYAAFEAWKSQDMHKLIDDLVSHFLDLERLWLSVKDQEDAETEWAPRIDEQQHQIHDRIEKFGAPAIARLEAARSRLHAELAAQDVEMVPSSPIRIPSRRTRRSRQTRASFISATSESAHRSTSPSCSSRSCPASRRMSSQSSRSGRSGSPTKSPERTGRQQQQQQPVTNDQRNEPSMPSASHGMAPAIQSVAPEFGQVFSNEQLAHELVMDPDFSLKRPKRSQFEEQVAAVARRAFFDGVRDEIAQSGYGSQALGILSDIKQGLLSMVSEQGHVAQEIHEALDFDLIKQQMSRFVFDLPRCIAYIASKMLQLSTETDVVSALARTLEIVDEMKLDLANYRVEYERQKFTVALANGQASLARTTEWLETAVHALESVAASRNPENLSHPDLRVRYEDVFHTAILSLVFGTTPIGPDNVPETLSMDAERLFGFQNEAQALTIVSALLMLSKNILPELRSEPLALKELRKKLFVLLKDSGTNVESLSLIIISTVNGLFARKAALLESLSQTTSSAHVLQAGGSHTRRVSSEQESLVRNMVDKTLSYRDPVFTLLSRRIQNVVRQHMDADRSDETRWRATGLT
ncbi:T-complex protein 11-domain-containing protein, partial [Entophlyctis helioformis]